MIPAFKSARRPNAVDPAINLAMGWSAALDALREEGCARALRQDGRRRRLLTDAGSLADAGAATP